MKNYIVLGLALCSAVVLSGCKSQESAYRQAYEKAKAQEMNSTNENTATTVTVTPENAAGNEQKVVVTPVTTTPSSSAAGNADVRTIPGGVTVVNGEALRAYSVIVGSFVTQSNAEGLMENLKSRGYAARVVRTNETINGHTGWYRVIASSYDDKASAAQSRDELVGTYPGAWLLHTK
mgnify:CR=1 FL=1